MTYIPHTDADRRAMFDACGIKDLDDLFAVIPEKYRFPNLELPHPLSELDVGRELQELSESNADVHRHPCFLGAGAYHHFIPSVVNHMIQRGEFMTAYTPYQPEVSQGTLQTIFEYQSMICALTGMEVSNASHYDGATSTAEAVIMAMNQFRGRRRKIIISSRVHPEYRAVVRTYMQGTDLNIVEGENGQGDLDDSIAQLDEETAVFIMQQPNFLGELEDMTGLANAVHDVGALLCVITNPIVLGILKPPGEYGADIVVGEGQPLGIPLSYGGPYLGFFATREKYVRKMSGRLVGETVDKDGKRGYVMTLTPREQHIRRETASSNICTNQGLMATAAAIYLSVMGKHGLRKVAELCYHRAHYAAQEIDSLGMYSVQNQQPFFHEFVLKCPKPVAEINSILFDDYGIIGGYDLSHDFSHLGHAMLIAITEMITREEIDDFVSALNDVAN